MNQLIGSLISANPRPTQQLTQANGKNSQSNDFKKTMDSALNDSKDEKRIDRKDDKAIAKKDNKKVDKKSNEKVNQESEVDETKDQVVCKQKEVEGQEEIELGEKISEPLETVPTDEICLDEQMIPILQMLMDTLDISKDQLLSSLDQLGLTPSDLMNEDNFRALIGEVLGDSDPMMTLDQETLKSIGKIWSEVEKTMIMHNVVPVEENVLQEVPKQEILQQDIPKGAVEIDKSGDSISVEAANESAEIVPTLEKVGSEMQQERNPKDEPEGEVIAKVTLPKTEDLLGLRIPIQQTFQGIQQVKEWGNTQQIGQMNSGISGKMIVDQIVQKIEINQLLRHNEIQMELTPKELGKLSLKLSEQGGVVTAQIKVESERTKELLMNNIDVLKENLEKQGLSVGSFQVDVKENTSQSQMYQQKQKASKRIEELMLKHMEEIESDEPEEKVAKHTQVDYMA